MGTRLGRRVVHFANLPIKLLMPNKLTNITEIALKTIPSASKIEIRRVLESLYGFEVEKVETLNMEGRKKKRGGILIAKPDYKKAYVTLRHPLSVAADLFPIKVLDDKRKQAAKSAKPSVVEEGAESEAKKHWLHGRGRAEGETPRGGYSHGRGNGGSQFPWTSMRSSSSSSSGSRAERESPRGGSSLSRVNGGAKFPWTSMRSSSSTNSGSR